MLSKFLANTIYVQVRKNAFHLRHIEDDKNLDVLARQPFTTTRLLVGEFEVAFKLLNNAAREIGADSRPFRASPVIVIHPLEMVEGGLSAVEEKVFMELASVVGARGAFLHVGEVLNDAEVLHLISQPKPEKPTFRGY